MSASVSGGPAPDSFEAFVNQLALDQAISDASASIDPGGIDFAAPLPSQSLQDEIFSPPPITAIVVDPVELSVNKMLAGPGPSNFDMGMDAIAMVTGLKAAQGAYQIGKVVGREILESALDRATDGAFSTLRFARSLFSSPATITIGVVDDGVPKSSGRVRVTEVDGDAFTATAKGKNGPIEIAANASRSGDDLVLDKLHIYGGEAGQSSLSELKDLAREFGKANGAKNVIIKGGFREKLGRTPRDIIVPVE